MISAHDITKSKKAEEEAAWNWRKMYLGGFELSHKKNGFLLEPGSPLHPFSLPSVLPSSQETAYELLGSSVCFISRELRYGQKKPQLGKTCKFLGASVSPALRWQGWWVDVRGPSELSQPKILPPFTSSWHRLTSHALKERRVLSMSTKILCLCIYLNIPWNQNCLMAQDLLNFHLFISLFISLVHRIPTSKNSVIKTLLRCLHCT